MSTPAHARLHLRAHRAATIFINQQPTAIRTVIDGPSGLLVAPVPHAALHAEELVLAVPEESPDVGEVVSLLARAHRIRPDSLGARDRWLAAHGQPQWSTWTGFWIDSARIGGEVIDGDELDLRNPLHTDEPALLRLLNNDETALARLVRRGTGITPTSPVAVGVDPDGVDVRSASTALPLRVPMPESPSSPEAAERVLRAMLAEASR